jgi:hypothetical protein
MTAASTPYASVPSTMWRARRRVEMPKPTTQASKLMQIRRKVSALIRRMSQAPSGTPMSRLGRSDGTSARLPAVNRPA